MVQLQRKVKSSLLSNFQESKAAKSIPKHEEDLDVERDPESSEDDLSKQHDIPLAKHRIAAAAAETSKDFTNSRSSFKAVAKGRPVAKPLVNKITARQTSKPASQAPISPGKRKRQEIVEDDEEDDDSLYRKVADVVGPVPKSTTDDSWNVEFMSSQQGSSQTRRNTSYGKKRSINIPSPVRPKPKAPAPGFKRPPNVSTEPEREKMSFITPQVTTSKSLREGSANPTFIRPRSLPPYDGASSPLSDAPPSSIHDMNEPISSISSPAWPSSPTYSTTIPCPICRTSVDHSLYTDFLSTITRKRLTTRDKLRFCETHNTATAQEKFRSAEYPTIDWAALPRRLEKMNSTVQALLTQEIHSTYRADLQSALRDGKTNFRHALRNPESMPAAATATIAAPTTNDDIITIPSSSAPMPFAGGSVTVASSQTSDAPQAAPKKTVAFGIAGYYGARGAKMIMEHVIQSSSLSQKLREVSATEKIYKALGVSGFVQAVVVPEIAWRLIREDMKLGGSTGTRKGGRRKAGSGGKDGEEEGEKQAKEILNESWEVGELVNHEEESEVVVMEEEDEGEKIIIDLDEDDYD